MAASLAAAVLLDTYLVLVRKGDTVAYESLVQHAHLALGEHSTTGAVKIFEMDDDGAKPMLIGRITISAPIVPGQKRRVTLLVNFGELELKIRAVNELTGQEWKASIQYDVTQDRSGTVSGTSSTGSSAPPAVKVTTSGPVVQHPVPRQPSPGPGNVTQLTRSMDRLTTNDAYYGGVPAADARRRSSTPSSPAAAPAQGQLPHLPQPLPRWVALGRQAGEASERSWKSSSSTIKTTWDLRRAGGATRQCTGRWLRLASCTSDAGASSSSSWSSDSSSASDASVSDVEVEPLL
ncbi:hypothetical protein AMAG_18483 [Allomyces macrogynus ATCC 38327]|uniref:Uncharacterized protein n=1 Tax=Allomyces macrogynus (strain ATCC 38327) TaxID=578462 RepID=A0A0L0SCA8_ALLM3|nr:hypothetical protein AMAG_18483 [Allomyces macrogynus ATCC 38327]|eukprot:KNE60188.1 hypothetical protein AMAG_18483 [Allomyces macrogynus ATCC 38327]